MRHSKIYLLAVTLALIPALLFRLPPIHAASQWNRAEIIVALEHSGADLGLQSSEGQTPVYVASYNGHLDALNTLLSLGEGFLSWLWSVLSIFIRT